MTREQFKQALISVGIGFLVSVLTICFQFLVEWLKQIPAELPGAVVGAGKYLFKSYKG